MTKGYWGIDIRECPEIVDDNDQPHLPNDVTSG
jgi:hypothetical protein